MPHMISVDRNNTVWITDVGRHQALQFSANGKLLREVGVKMTPGHDTEHLCKPTQVGLAYLGPLPIRSIWAGGGSRLLL
jgi:hypothetical protein